MTGASFDELVAGVAELDAVELATRLVELESERRRVEAELAAVVAGAERRVCMSTTGTGPFGGGWLP